MSKEKFNHWLLKRVSKDFLVYGILFFITGLYLVFNAQWLIEDQSIPVGNPAWNFCMFLKFKQIIADFVWDNWTSFASDAFHPPFVFFPLLPFNKFIGFNIDKAVLVLNSIFIPILVYSTYAVSRLLIGQRSLGVLAVILVLCWIIA